MKGPSRKRRNNGNVKIDRSVGCRKGETIAELYQRRIDGALAAAGALASGKRRAGSGAPRAGGQR
jgi:hypothetical protein